MATGRGRRGFHRGGRAVHNEALLRYTRDELLSLFSSAQPTQADLTSEVYLAQSTPALLVLGQPFSHPLGDDVNAERHVKAPEWFDKPREPKQHEEIFEEKYSAIDRQMDQKLKVEEEKEEPLPEWAESTEPAQTPEQLQTPEQAPEQLQAPEQAPEQLQAPPMPESLSPPDLPKSAPQKELRTVAKFSHSLLQKQVDKGDPFAKCISANSRKDENYVYVEEGSEPEERVWYYRDPKGQVQGPFSWVDMYHWNLVGYFPATLPVALQRPEGFAPLAELFVLSLETKPQEPEFSLFAYHPDKGRKPPSPPKPTGPSTAWGPKERPAASSLADIQREQREGARKG